MKKDGKSITAEIREESRANTDHFTSKLYNDIYDGKIEQSIALEQIKMRRTAQEILEKHLEKHTIGYAESQEVYYTYVPDPSKSSGRKQLRKKKKEDLIEAIVNYYQHTYESGTKKYTFRNTYLEWLEYKEGRGGADTYIKRFQCTWNKFYENAQISDVDMQTMKPVELEKWFISMIKEHELDKKGKGNLIAVGKQIIEYANRMQYINVNPYTGVDIPNKLLRQNTEKPRESRIFFEDEQEKVEDAAWEMYCNGNRTDTLYLAIPFAFVTGARQGEIAALRFDDINKSGDSIHICREETKRYERDGFGGRTCGCKVVEHTKSEAGDRWVWLPEEARRILKTIKDGLIEAGEKPDGYIFKSKGTRATTIQIAHVMKKCCIAAGMDTIKGMHCARRSFISTAINSGVDRKIVCQNVGHASYDVTEKHYRYSRETPEEARQSYENAFKRKHTDTTQKG